MCSGSQWQGRCADAAAQCPQCNGLRVNAFDGGALAIEIRVSLAVAVEVSLRRQAGLGIETQRLIWCWHQRKTQQGYETRVLQEEAFEFFG